LYGLVFKAHRLCASLNSRFEKKKKHLVRDRVRELARKLDQPFRPAAIPPSDERDPQERDERDPQERDERDPQERDERDLQERDERAPQERGAPERETPRERPPRLCRGIVGCKFGVP